MASRLSAIEAAVVSNLATGGVTSKVGAQYLEGQGAPPMLVWVQRGDVKHTVDNEHTAGELEDGTIVRQILTRSLPIEVHLWAATFDLAEALVLDLIAAAHLALSTSCHYLGESWPKQAKFERMKRGEPVIVKLVVDTPAIDTVPTTVTIEDVDTQPLEWVDDIEDVRASAEMTSAAHIAATATVT